MLSPFPNHNTEADSTLTMLLGYFIMICPNTCTLIPKSKLKEAKEYSFALDGFPHYVMSISTPLSSLQGARRTKWTTQQFSSHLILTQDFHCGKGKQIPAQQQTPASKIQQKGSVKKLSFPLKPHSRREKENQIGKWKTHWVSSLQVMSNNKGDATVQFPARAVMSSPAYQMVWMII